MKKRLLICFMTLMVLYSNFVPICFAESNTLNDEDYIDEVLSRYLTVNGEALSDKMRITQGHTIEGNSGSTLYFIFEDNTYIGRLTVSNSGSNMISSFCFDNNTHIEGVILEDMPFSVAALTESLLILYTDEGVIPLNGSVEEYTTYLNENSSSLNGTLTKAEWRNIDFGSMVQPAIDTSGYSVSLNVPIVANGTADDGEGLCWAACICSIKKFYGGSTMSARSLYDALAEEYDGTPVGTELWILRGFTYRGLNAGHYAPISWSSLYNKLNSSRPVMFIVTRTGGSHAIVCKSFVGGDGYAVYGFMDPNVTTGYVYTTYNSSTLNLASLPYNNGLRQYTGVNTVYYCN